MAEHFAVKFFRENRRFSYFIGALALLLIVLAVLQPAISRYIKSDPELRDTYEFVKNQLDKNSLLWLFIITIIGSLFIVMIPTDVFFLYYLVAGKNIVAVVAVYFVAVMLGRMIDYWTGYAFSGYVTHSIIRKDYDMFQEHFRRWGNSALFFGNVIPFFPIEFFIVFIGTIKFSFWKFLAYNSMGKAIKVIVMAIFVRYIISNGMHLVSFDFFQLLRSILELFLPHPI